MSVNQVPKLLYSELNESYKLKDSETEGSDDLGDSAASGLTDNDEIDDIVDEVKLMVPQVDNSSHASLPTGSKDCDILLQADLSVEQKLEITLNFSEYNPSATYTFPTKIEYRKNRAFHHRYLQRFHWLGYSICQDGCVCLPCCLFSPSQDNLQNFVLQPFRNWTKLNERVKAHSVSPFHLKCVMAMECFKDTHSGLQPTIDTSFDKRRQELYDFFY